MLEKLLQATFLSILVMSSPVFSQEYDNLKNYSTLENADKLFQNEEITTAVKNLLKSQYDDFAGNFDVFGEPHLLNDGGVFVDGWLQHLRQENASALVVKPDGKIYAAWVTPDSEKIMYVTNDTEAKSIQPDINAWASEFKTISFQGKVLPKPLADNESKVKYFESPKFSVKVILSCADRSVACNKATYFGKRKSDGETVRLLGKVVRTQCDSAICPVSYYEFENRNTKYKYLLKITRPSLEVSIDNKTMVTENGVWSNGTE
ncbi:hypothetical protein N5923_08905 [Erwiniaceae bacterium BAC15a-03b]|uniref:Uncharacterized protein n=1 Tax=Winslowiella arboricola TaxID=2978220 RepID=A0A9J6PH25_9GAMM|nr:hypothetical protein [Winslowiella arboricola]MCU5771720.1 hypothetical protein [Winslowiella arboricola]MCU5777609.1 hypothetical protein [Winslowiella arboricola]